MTKKEHPLDHPVLVVFVLGGITAREVREITELFGQQGKVKVTVTHILNLHTYMPRTDACARAKTHTWCRFINPRYPHFLFCFSLIVSVGVDWQHLLPLSATSMRASLGNARTQHAVVNKHLLN